MALEVGAVTNTAAANACAVATAVICLVADAPAAICPLVA